MEISKSLLSRLEWLSQERVRSTTQRQGSFSHWCGLIFSEISTSRPSCSFMSETKVPRYPASAQNFWIDGHRSYARFAVDIPPFVSWILAAWTTTDNKQPSTSTTMCRFLPFVFFHRQFHVLRWLLPFSRSGNQWSHSLGSPCVRHLFASFLQDVLKFYPTVHWFGRGDKSYVPLNMVENHGVTVSIYNLNPPSTVQHPSIPVCSTCFSASLCIVGRFLPTARLSSRLDTTFVFFLPCIYFTTVSSSCEYRFLQLFS